MKVRPIAKHCAPKSYGNAWLPYMHISPRTHSGIGVSGASDGFQLGLVAVVLSMPPFPVFPLLAAVRLGEVYSISGMHYPVIIVIATFAVIPVMVVTVVAIVESDADLWGCGIGPNCHRSNQSDCQEK